MLARLRRHHADAVFFCTLASGLELRDSADRVRRSAADGLAVFDVAPDGDGPPDVDRRWVDGDEARWAAECCYELLLRAECRGTLIE